MDPLLTAWKCGYFTDQELCNKFQLTHLELREKLINLDETYQEAMSVECRQELKELYDMAELDSDYRTLDNLAERYKCSASAIRRAMINGAEGKILAKKDIETLVHRMLADKIPQTDIAKALGISQATVSKLNPNPIKRPRGKKLSPKQWDELMLQLPYFTVTELARMYQTSRASIYARIKLCSSQ